MGRETRCANSTVRRHSVRENRKRRFLHRPLEGLTLTFGCCKSDKRIVGKFAAFWGAELGGKSSFRVTRGFVLARLRMAMRGNYEDGADDDGDV
jgi:hypothetical protein